MVVVSAIDNLVKGASGQAIQNMNLMFDLPDASAVAVTQPKNGWYSDSGALVH